MTWSVVIAAIIAFSCGALISGMLVHTHALVRQSQSEAELRLQYSGADGSSGGPLQQSLAPINEKLRTLSTLVDQTNRNQTEIREQFVTVQGTATDLRDETRALNRIFNNTRDRGAWGELQLRRIVELAGMVNRVDFDEQVHIVGTGTTAGNATGVSTAAGDGTAARPDMIINLDQGRTIVLDAKFPLSAMTGTAPAAQAQKHHATLIRSHIDALSKKDYLKHFARTPEFVIMFIPAESLLAEALRAEPSLFEYASKRNVIPTTPTTLLALLRTVAMSWRNYELAENAQEILRESQELANRLGKAYEYFNSVGGALAKAVDSYNSTIGSWDSRLTPQIRRLGELQLAPDKSVKLQQIDKAVRRPIPSADSISEKMGARHSAHNWQVT